MRILYITHSPIIGGAELSLLEHLRELDKSKVQPILVCSEKLIEKASKIEGVKVIKMDFYLLYRFNPKILINYVRMVLNINRIVRKEKIELIHTNSVKAHYIGILSSIITKTALVLWMRDTTMNKFIFNLTKNIPKKIVYISHFVESYFGKAPNTVVIYNGTHIYKKVIAENEKIELKKELGIENQIVIICNERLVKWKGVQVLVKAINRIKDENFICLIAGSGGDQRDNYEEHLKKEVRDLKLSNKIKFLGWRNDLYKIYQIGHILIHPNIEPEPFGLVVIEAMSLGLAVVSSNIGGPSEIIEDTKDGFLIEPNNSKILSEKIIIFLKDLQLKKEIGDAAKLKIKNNFTQEIETSKVEKLYTKILSS